MYEPIPFIENDGPPEWAGRAVVAAQLDAAPITVTRYEELGILPKPKCFGPRSHRHDISRIPKMISARTLAARRKVTTATLYRWAAEGKLAKPYKIGPNSTRWLDSETVEG